MSELLKRLVQLTRAHVSDFLAQYLPGQRTDSFWDGDFDTRDDTATNDRFSAPPFETYTGNGLPYSAELAAAYRALDLPYGAPLEQVAKRWKAYLKKCHPDRYANDPDKLADATRLTQELTSAYEKIKTAWDNHQG
jgi:DnaJ-domain-containing protein 1